MLGGTLTELAWAHGARRRARAPGCDELGIDRIEVSSGTVAIPPDEKARLIETARRAAHGLRRGRREGPGRASWRRTAGWSSSARRSTPARELVVCEGRATGTAGLYRARREARTGLDRRDRPRDRPRPARLRGAAASTSRCGSSTASAPTSTSATSRRARSSRSRRLRLGLRADTVAQFHGRGGVTSMRRRDRRPADRRRQALRHRQRVRRARVHDRRRPQPARAGAVRGRPARRAAADRRPRLRPVPASSSCAEHGVGAVVPLTDLDIEVLAAAGDLPAFVPAPEIARATYDKYETHELLLGTACRRRRPSCPGERADVLSGDGQAAPRLGRALDPPGRRPRGDGVLRRLRQGAGDGPAAHGRAGVLDRHASATSTGAA